jgi:hypothetical protein
MDRGVRAAAAMLLLAGCAVAQGAPAELCDAGWRSRDSVIVEPGGIEEQPVAIDCLRALERRRLRIGFTMPPGPDCHTVSRIEVVETADAVSVTVFLARRDDPNAGACPAEPRRVRTELDLQQAAGRRELLDGSREEAD